MIRSEGEGFAETGHGLIQPSQMLEHITKIVVRLGVFGLDSECFLKSIDGIRHPLKVQKHGSQVVVSLRQVRAEGEGLFETCNRIF